MGTPRHNEVIYKRRRLAALVILLVVVALIIWAVVAMRGGSTDETENTAATSALGTTSVVEMTSSAADNESTKETSSGDAAGSSVDSTSSSDKPGESKEPRESKDPSEDAKAKDSCDLSDLVITASSNKPNYPSGEEPQLFMTVTNPTAVDCEIDLDDNVLRFEVYNLANNARVWSDVDCNPAVETGSRVFPAGEERYFQAIWSRTTSAPEKCSTRQSVPAGSYFLHTVIGSNPSQALTFNLG